ncbi:MULTISPECIES: DUF596 domain-containing protein [unclassified Acinetobacter]|uniref:DUF596 domain-containing protein n=1 Tax=unclassified Acinetobacter TaxID=196816 RepID=UPI0035B9970B
MEKYTFNYTQTQIEEDMATALALSLNLGSSIWFVIDDGRFKNFEEKKEAFLILLKACLNRGILKLQKEMQIIEHTAEEWEKIFRTAFPKNEIEYSDNPTFAPFDISMWFITEDCPAYAVWIDPISKEMDWTS